MDKFGGLFNLTVTDLKSVLGTLGFGKAGDERKSLRQRRAEFRQLDRDLKRINHRLDQVNNHKNKFDNDLIQRIETIRNAVLKEKNLAEDNLKEQELLKELTRTGVIGKISDTIQDLKSMGTLEVLTNFLLGKGLVAGAGSAIAVITSNFQSMNNLIDETGFFSSRVLDNFMMLRREMELVREIGHEFAVTTQTHLKIATQLRQVHGEIGRVSVSTLDNIANLEYVLGVNNEEALTFLDTFRGITGASIETNLNLLETTAILASNENIPFRALMEDISSNADFFARNMINGTEGMLKSSVFARRLGIELSTITTMISGMSDLENVIDSSMRLSLITGREINFLASANEAFWGRTEQATRMLLGELSKVDEMTFNIPFVREQFAEQLGVSVSELVKMRQAIHAVGLEATMVDFGMNEDVKEFSDIVGGLGFRRLGIEIQKNIIRPFNSVFDRHMASLENIIGKAVGFIEKTGNVIQWYFDKLGVAGAVLPAFIAGVGKIAGFSAIQTAVAGEQLRELKKQTLLLFTNGKSMSSGVGKKAMGFGLGALGMTMGMGMSHAGNVQDDDALMWSGVLLSALSGAVAGGMMTANPFGALAGGVIGGVSGALPMIFGDGLASGGIVTKPMISPIGELAKKGQKEAVVPLNSSRGKDMMQLDLSDESISKLVSKMKDSGLSPQISFSYNGKKVDDSEQFFKMVAGTA